MNQLDEVTASGAVGPQPATRRVRMVKAYCTAAGVVELWDTTGNDGTGGAVRRLTLAPVANQDTPPVYLNAAFSQGVYVKIVSGTGVRVSIEHGM